MASSPETTGSAGSSFDDFLDEQGIRKLCEETAKQRVARWNALLDRLSDTPACRAFIARHTPKRSKADE